MGKDIALEAGDAATDGLADAAAIDDLYARVRPQPSKLTAHHLGIGRGPARHP